MTAATSPEPGVRRDLSERMCDAAAAIITAEGWARVTMARLAEEVGVSRQTVYNEIGTKNDLAEAVVLRELDRFLAVVVQALDDHPDDLIAAIEAATRRVLEYAEGNALLHAVVSATHGADTELLPLLTTHAESLLLGARLVVAERVEGFRIDLPEDRLEVGIEMVVRLVLSHVMQPSASPAETGADVAWLAARVLG